jgi:hypothetical protein
LHIYAATLGGMSERYEKLSPEQRAKAAEATRRWRERNRERANALARANQKKWRAENPELHRQRAKDWKAANYERYLERHTKWRHANREYLNEYKRHQRFRLEYNLTIEERDRLLANQGGGCKACGATEPGATYGWSVDHCHSSGKVRGILCHSCNLALGLVQDDIDRLIKLIGYLRTSHE